MLQLSSSPAYVEIRANNIVFVNSVLCVFCRMKLLFIFVAVNVIYYKYYLYFLSSSVFKQSIIYRSFLCLNGLTVIPRICIIHLTHIQIICICAYVSTYTLYIYNIYTYQYIYHVYVLYTHLYV